MKMNFKSFFAYGAIIFGMHNSVNAQYALKEADRAFEQYDFQNAIKLYEQAYKKKPTLFIAERLVSSYKQQSNYKQTESWAAIAAGMSNTAPENVLAYAKALQASSKYSEAKQQYLKYISLNPNVDIKTQELWIKSCDSSILWMSNPRKFSIINETTLNSPQSDWGATVENGSIVFSSDRPTDGGAEQHISRPFLRFDGAKGPNKGVYSWTGNHYLRIYIKRKDSNVVMYPINAGTDYHVGPATFTAANDEAYFTITRFPRTLNYKEDSILKRKLATVRVEIYSLTKNTKTGIWSKKPISFKYNNVANYSVGDPFISADGQRLYFCSNMPGGRGGLDLYVSHRATDGQWGTPINLGDINTAGDDRGPSVGVNGKFYFSSDGRVGMGGLDIFRAKIDGDQITAPENLNYPLNSPQDDFAFTLLSENTGYLASNRYGGLGSDDIYSFVEQKELNLMVSGVAYNTVDRKPLKDVVVSLAKHGLACKNVITDEQGFYKFSLDSASNYSLTGDKTNFISAKASISTVGLVNTTALKQDLFLTPIELGKPIKLENIYYDFDKSNIRPDAALELNKLVNIMKDNPNIWIELRSHTDSRGSGQYNLKLSQDRADSAVQYIIDKGVDKSRISAKGYGETLLTNNCSDGVKCSIASHQQNRRTEFLILKQ